MKKKELTKKDYDNYMKVVNKNIEETERRLENLNKSKKVSKFSFEDWCKFQNGELKLSETKNLTNNVELEEVVGSSCCEYSVIENKLAILSRNQQKIFEELKKINKKH